MTKNAEMQQQLARKKRKEDLRQKRREAKQIMKRKKKQALEAELDEIERHIQEGNITEHHKRLRQIKKGYQARNNMIRNRDGIIISNEKDILQEWENFFKTYSTDQNHMNPCPKKD